MTDYVPTLVQGGAVGISFALIWLLFWLIKTIVGNHIAHSNQVQMEMTKAIQKLSDVITSLDRRLNGR
jgi:hypothetical protein